MNSEKEGQIIEDFKAGIKLSEIREKYSVGNNTVYRILENAGLARRNKKDVPTIEQLEQYYIVENHSLKETKKEFNLSSSVFYRLVEEYGLNKTRELETTRSKQSLREKYGVDNVSKLETVKGVISEAVKTIQQKRRIDDSPEDYFRNYLVSSGTYDFNSSGRNELLETLDHWNIEYKLLVSGILDKQEIEIFIPSKNIGIEFNDSVTHRDNTIGKRYHQNKSKAALKNGVFLYHIFEYEWNNEYIRPKIINQLHNLLGLNTRRIGARQCHVSKISTEEAQEFMNANHIQGTDRAPIRLGLFYNLELLAVMTFSKPRFSKQYEYELSRFCCKQNVTVNGGSAKLFKDFLREYDPESIVSYSDNAKTRGTMYSHLGFVLDHESDGNYVWCKGNKTLTRYQCQRHKLVEKFPELDGLSETEIMTYLGWHKISDCGNKVWVYNRL